MVMDPLLFQGQSLDLQLCALGLLHGLELMGCRHGPSEGGRLGQVTERSTCKMRNKKKWEKPGSVIVAIFEKVPSNSFSTVEFLEVEN